LLFDGILRADEWPKLTGSNLAITDALSQSDFIFIGKIPQMSGEAASTIRAIYGGVHVNVLRTLRGTLVKQISVSLDVFMADKGEEKPKTGSPYIFFVRKTIEAEGDDMALKILPATDNNVAAIKKLVVGLPVK